MDPRKQLCLRSSTGKKLYSVALAERSPVFGDSAHVAKQIQNEIRRRLSNPEAAPAIICSHWGALQQSAGIKRTVSAASLNSVHSMRTSDVESDAASERSETSSQSRKPLEDLTLALASSSSSSDSQNNSRRSRVTWQDCQSSMDTCHRAFLVSRIHDLERKLVKTKTELAKEKRISRTLQKKADNWQLKIHDDRETQKLDQETLAISRINENGVRFSIRGFLAMGIRKALALTSALGFPMAALVDVSRQTVTRSEVSVWTLLVARTGAFHELMRQRLRILAHMFANMQRQKSKTTTGGIGGEEVVLTSSSGKGDDDSFDTAVAADLGFGDDSRCECSVAQNGAAYALGSGNEEPIKNEDGGSLDGVFCLGGTAFAGDATNSGIWRRNKLQGLLLSSAFMTDARHLRSETEYLKAFVFHTTVCLGMHVPACRPVLVCRFCSLILTLSILHNVFGWVGTYQ